MKKKISVLFLVMLISNQVDAASKKSDVIPFLLSGYCSKEALKKVLENGSEYFGLSAGAQKVRIGPVSCEEINDKVVEDLFIRSKSIVSDIHLAFLASEYFRQESKSYRQESKCYRQVSECYRQENGNLLDALTKSTSYIEALKQGIVSLQQSNIDLNDRLNEKLACLSKQNTASKKQQSLMMVAHAQLLHNLRIVPKVKKAHHNSGGVFSGHSQYSQPPSNSNSYGCFQEVGQRSSVSAFAYSLDILSTRSHQATVTDHQATVTDTVVSKKLGKGAQ